MEYGPLPSAKQLTSGCGTQEQDSHADHTTISNFAEPFTESLWPHPDTSPGALLSPALNNFHFKHLALLALMVPEWANHTPV